MNAYTQIVAVIVVPAQAAVGEIVNVYVDIKSIYNATVHVYSVGVLDDGSRINDWTDHWIGPGQTMAFDGQFVMPNRSVVVYVDSCYEAGDGSLVLDDRKSVNVALIGAPTPPPTIGWQKLDSGTFTVAPPVTPTPITTWVKLDYGTITITPTVVPTPVGGWQMLDYGTITIKPTTEPIGWTKLDSRILKVGGEEGLNKYLPWIAGIAAGGLAIYAVKKSQEN